MVKEKLVDIMYWSESNEVDFVYGNKAINVTSSEKIPKRESMGLIEFKKKYKNFSLFLIAPKQKRIEEIEMITFKLFLDKSTI